MKQNTCIIKDEDIDAEIGNISIQMTLKELDLLNRLVYAAKISNTGMSFTDTEGNIHNLNKVSNNEVSN